MKNRLHVLAVVLFVVSFLYDIVVWGGVRQLPDVGPASPIPRSARHRSRRPISRSASIVDSAMPSLGSFGSARLTDAFGEGFERIRDDPTVAMDLVFGTDLERDARLAQDDVLGHAGVAADRADPLGAPAEAGPRRCGAERTSGRLDLFTCGCPNTGAMSPVRTGFVRAKSVRTYLLRRTIYEYFQTVALLTA